MGSRSTAAETPAIPRATAASACRTKFAEKLYGVTKVGTKVVIEG